MLAIRLPEDLEKRLEELKAVEQRAEQERRALVSLQRFLCRQIRYTHTCACTQHAHAHIVLHTYSKYTHAHSLVYTCTRLEHSHC